MALRLACFLAAGTSDAALLAKVYGIASMRTATLAAVVPCSLALFGVWAWGRRGPPGGIADRLAVGFVGGVLGTATYDLVRVPFHLAGQRIFAPIPRTAC